MDQRFILLPRASSSYQLRGVRYHPKSIPRTTHNSVHRQRNNMALGVLALHHPCRDIPDSGLVPGRDAIRPQHPQLREGPTGLSYSAHARHRAGQVPQATESLAIMHAPHRGDNKDTCPHYYNLLFPQLRLGHWCQHNGEHLVDTILWLWASRHW